MAHFLEGNIREDVDRRGLVLALRTSEFHGCVRCPVIANHPISRFAAQINIDLALSLTIENLLRFQISSNFRTQHSDSESALILSHLRLIADVQFRPDARGRCLPLFDFSIGKSGEEQSSARENEKNKKDEFGGASHAASCHANFEFAIIELVIEIVRLQCPP